LQPGGPAPKVTMRVLFVTPTFPEPLDSGIRRRMAVSLRELAAAGDVTLLSLCRDSDDGTSRAGVLARCADVITVPYAAGRPRPRDLRSRLRGLSEHLFDPRPLTTRLLDGAPLHPILRGLRPESFDLVWVQSLGLYGQLRRYELSPVVVDVVDAESIKAARDLRRRLWNPRFPLEALDLLKLQHAQRHWGANRHWFIVCSENDRNHLARKGDRIWVVRNGVELPAEIDGSAEEENALVYVGTFAYGPNREGVLYFTREILPLIGRYCPAVRFYIVGSSPPPEITSLHREPKVIVTGSVESVEPYLRRASVAVVPLLNAAGTRIKILEAMSYRKPVVATSIGAEGLAVEHGRNILLADTPQQFASCCVELLRDASLRSRLGAAGRQFVEGRHRLEHAQTDLRRFLSHVLSFSFRDSSPLPLRV